VAKLRHRYQVAASCSAGRDVLEVGCGAGLGLGCLERVARRVVGGDYCVSNLQLAQAHYNGRVPLLRFDAGAMPFGPRSFDVVVLFEALYYLPRPQAFIAECGRLLRPGGLLLIATVNPRWRGFHPSPFAQRYFSAAELHALLAAGGFSVETAGAFRESAGSARERLVSQLKRVASSAGVIPRTMRGKEALKRIFFGPLQALPPEIGPVDADAPSPTRIDPSGSDSNPFTVLYAFGRIRSETE
jgi:SAM-dependent methyltransferase